MMDGDARITLGVVIGAFGLRGEVVVKITGDDPESLGRYPSVHVTPPHVTPGHVAPGQAGTDSGERLDIEWCRAQKGRALIRFSGDAHRRDAEARIGSTIWLTRAELKAPEEGRWYFVDLVGLTVVTTEGAVIGTVREVMENPANDLFVVEYEGREVLIPNVGTIVKDVDLTGRRIVIDPLPGLLDI